MRERRDPGYARALAAVGAALLAGPGAAAAQGPLPEDNAGTSQYVEPLPDPGGDRKADPDRAEPGRRLPAQVRDALPPGAEGRVLERLVTDPGSGATGGATPPRLRRSGRGAGADASREGAGSGAIDATASAVGGSKGPTVAAVVAALVGLTLGMAGVTVRRRRRT